MASHEIVPLKCPSCGSSTTGPSKPLAFGAEFSCTHCGCTAVLIINRELVALSSLQKQGEKVCIACGRIAQREARFCQEGHALVRTCVKCLTEFAVDHQRCDSCGWLQSVKPGSLEGEALAFDKAVRDLADPSYQEVGNALKVISAGGGNASEAAVQTAVAAIHSLMRDPSFRRNNVSDSGINHLEMSGWVTLGRLGRPAVPAIHDLVMDRSLCRSFNREDGYDATDRVSWQVLEELGPAAREALPMLRQRMEEIWPTRLDGSRNNTWQALIQCIGGISPEDALAYCSRRLDEAGKNGSGDSIIPVVYCAFRLGRAAIPVLEKFCGLFSGNRGRACRDAISALRNGQPSVNLGYF